MNSLLVKTSAALSLAALLCASTALAGPSDVAEEPQGALQPHHILNEPTAPEPEPELPQPPEEEIDINSASGITVSEATSSYESHGLDSTNTHLFEPSIWQYLDVNEARTLLDGLPKTIASSTMRHAIRDLLLFKAHAPRNAKDGWLIARGDALARIGYMVPAANLLSSVPASIKDKHLAESAALRLMQAGEYETACGVAPSSDEQSSVWQRFALFCHAIAGQSDKADLAISLAEESGTAYPKWFVSLLDSLQYDNSRISLPSSHLKGLDLAMMLYAGESRLPSQVKVMSYLDQPEFQHLIGNNENYQTPTRIAYLEALGQRIEPEATLADLYGTLSKRSVSDKQRAMLRRANAYDRLASAMSSNQAAKRASKALSQFKQDGLTTLRNQLLTKPLTALSHSMKRQASYIDYAPEAFAILMLADETGALHKWLDLMDVHRTDDIQTYVAHELVQFERHANDKSLSVAAKELPPFLLPENADKTDLRLLIHFYNMIDQFGFTPPSITREAAYELLGTNEPRPNPAPTIIGDYATRGSLAGILLGAASLFGDHDLNRSSDELIIETVNALQKVKQPELAKKLSIESVLVRF